MADTSTAHVRHAVRNARDEQGFTQDELAKRAGVSRQWLAGFESGRMSNPRWASIVSVLNELGLTLTVRADQEARPAQSVSKVPRDVAAPKLWSERAHDADVLSSVLDRTKRAALMGSPAMVQAAQDAHRSLAATFQASLARIASQAAAGSIGSAEKDNPALNAALDAITSFGSNDKAAVKAAQQAASAIGSVYGDNRALKAALDATSHLASIQEASSAVKADLDVTRPRGAIGEGGSAVKAAQEQARQVAALLDAPAIQAAVKAARRTGRP